MKKTILALALMVVLISCSTDTKVETPAVDSTVVPVDTTVCPLVDSVSVDTTKRVK